MLNTNRNPTGIAPVLQVHPLRRCNLSCAHCYTASGPAYGEQLDIELLTACLDDAAALGYRQLAVSGGEPLLYKPLPRLLVHAKSLGMVTTLTSNGMLATPERWQPLAEAIDVAAISIDGRPEEHDGLRRQPGAFARTLANLEIIRASGVAFGFIFTLTQHNADSLEFVVRVASQQGARSVQVHPLTLSGHAARTMPGARPDSVELMTAFFEAARLGKKYGVVVHVDAVSVGQLAAYREHFVPARPLSKLTDVAPTLIVRADAEVVPLTHEVNRQLHLGSLADKRLAALAHSWLQTGRGDRLAEACEQTWTALTKKCAGTMVTWYDEVAARTVISRKVALSPQAMNLLRARYNLAAL